MEVGLQPQAVGDEGDRLLHPGLQRGGPEPMPWWVSLAAVGVAEDDIGVRDNLGVPLRGWWLLPIRTRAEEGLPSGSLHCPGSNPS